MLVIIAVMNIYHSLIHHTLSSVSVHPCSLTNSICEQNECSHGSKFLLRSWDMVWISTHLPGSKGGSGLECPGGSWGLGIRYQVGLASRGLGSLGPLTSFSVPPSATLRSQRILYIHAWSGSPLPTFVPAGGLSLNPEPRFWKTETVAI